MKLLKNHLKFVIFEVFYDFISRKLGLFQSPFTFDAPALRESSASGNELLQPVNVYRVKETGSFIHLTYSPIDSLLVDRFIQIFLLFKAETSFLLRIFLSLREKRLEDQVKDLLGALSFSSFPEEGTKSRKLRTCVE